MPRAPSIKFGRARAIEFDLFLRVRDELDFEDEVGIRWNVRRAASGTVSEGRRNEESADAARLHAWNPLLPALD